MRNFVLYSLFFLLIMFVFSLDQAHAQCPCWEDGIESVIFEDPVSTFCEEIDGTLMLESDNGLNGECPNFTILSADANNCRVNGLAGSTTPCIAFDGSESDPTGVCLQELSDFCADEDGDGVINGIDQCEDSITDATIIIDGCDSGVENSISGDGCSISDLIADIADNASNHGKFVSGVAHLLNDLKKSGLISGKEKGAVQKCAAKADIP